MKNENDGNTEIKYFTYTIQKAIILNWLKIVKKYSNHIKDLETALEVAKIHAPKEQMDEICTIATLYRAECSGLIKPPISIKKLFMEL